MVTQLTCTLEMNKMTCVQAFLESVDLWQAFLVFTCSYTYSSSEAGMTREESGDTDFGSPLTPWHTRHSHIAVVNGAYGPSAVTAIWVLSITEHCFLIHIRQYAVIFASTTDMLLG